MLRIDEAHSRSAEGQGFGSGEESDPRAFSEEQSSLYSEHVPEGIELDDLAILGPILVLKVKFAPEDYARKLAAELWLYPDNSMILELSTRCAPSEAFQVAAELRIFLTQREVDLTAEQETKTKRALEFFTQRLAGQGQERRG